uniref:Disease resistance R13L4/SHOC-2-like LRR domain-containing protein n=1 Tax=Odontella aurita TaxID=265563 RepID=A0A7S4M6H5_9STRA
MAGTMAEIPTETTPAVPLSMKPPNDNLGSASLEAEDPSDVISADVAGDETPSNAGRTVGARPGAVRPVPLAPDGDNGGGGGDEAAYLAYTVNGRRRNSGGSSTGRGSSRPSFFVDETVIEGRAITSGTSGRRSEAEAGETKLKGKRRAIIIVGKITAVVVVAAAIAATVVVTSRGHGMATTETTEEVPADEEVKPAVSNSSLDVAVISVIHHMSSQSDLSDPLTAQSRALEWMLNTSATQSYYSAFGNDGSVGDAGDISEMPLRIVQRYVLAVIFFATGGSMRWWVQSDGFLSAERHECEWFGVGCGEDGEFIQSIALGRNNLTGTLPDEIQFLTNLTFFATDYNQIEGTLATTIGNLSNLEYLNIGYNQISGSLPGSIGDLSSLSYLGMSRNAFVGTIPPSFGRLQQLRHLAIARNSLSGGINFLTDLGKVAYFSVQVNQMSGTIPKSIENARNLVIFSLSNNKFNGTIPESVSLLSKLDVLDLSNNMLSGTLLESLADMRGMHQLLLSGNRLRGTIPNSITSMSNLVGITLDTNNLSGTIPTALGAMANLRAIYLHSNRLEGGVPSAIGDISNMSFVDVTDNPLLSGTVPLNLGKLSRLAFLSMSATNLTGNIDFLCSVPLLYGNCAGPDPVLTCKCCHDHSCCDMRLEHNPACSAHFFQFAFFIDPDYLASWERCVGGIYFGTVSHCNWEDMADAYVSSNILKRPD